MFKTNTFNCRFYNIQMFPRGMLVSVSWWSGRWIRVHEVLGSNPQQEYRHNILRKGIEVVDWLFLE